MNNFDITDVETLFGDALRELGFSNVWYNRPKAVSDSILDFVTVRVVGGINDRKAFGACTVSVTLYAKDIKSMKNTKKLSVMQSKLDSFPLWINPLLIGGTHTIVGDTADGFGFHARIINFHVTIKTV